MAAVSRSRLYADPTGRFLHDLVLESCRRSPQDTAIVDTSLPEPRRISYREYGELVTNVARGLVASGLRPGEVIGLFLPNCWEYCVAYHAATLAGGIPSPLNPSYRERELRYQLENSDATMLITDGAVISAMNLEGLPALRRVFTTREGSAGSEAFTNLLRSSKGPLPEPAGTPEEVLAALPYSSGTTGLPKGVMLSHFNLVVNVYQVLAAAPFEPLERALCFLPLYHIYGLNVVLNSLMALGGTLVLMPRFELNLALKWLEAEAVTFLPLVPPVMNVLSQAAEQGLFPKNHRIRWAKSGAAPLAPELARRFTALTGIRVVQGYGMTEASPVTHMGFLDGPLYRPESIGAPVALTECVVISDDATSDGKTQTGELVMRGPQFMLGYWKSPEATAEVLRPLEERHAATLEAHAGASTTAGQRGTASEAASAASAQRAHPELDRSSPDTRRRELWYFSGDVVRVDSDGQYYIVDRRKELIKYKGFTVAPAEVESVLLDHPAVRDCGVVGQFDDAAGEVPVAFVVLHDGHTPSRQVEQEIRAWLSERITRYKQPREIRFVDAIPRNPSGKILRRELRKRL